ncbi:MAG: tripartite tricarboxylate transporter substrate binding protein [Betaproteobacteria bacterium]|nr:tripartite tricarboxylate transporter substrate binding protein [Betaproteobacteria bacterium]
MQRQILAVLLAIVSCAAFAQDYPSRPIRFVVSYPPGGGVDLMGRLVANALSARIGQPVVVENRAGAGGAVGTGVVAKATPDGYTVLVGSNAAITQAPHLSAHPYDPFKDLAPLVKGVNVPTTVLVAANSPFRTMNDLLEFARANPGKVSWGTPGNGSGMHVELELLKEKLALDITHIPYKGAAPIMADTMGGQITVGAPGIPSTIGNIRGGKLRLLAVWSGTRAGVFPDAPTVKEVTRIAELEGYPTWYGLMLPAGVPREIAAKLEAEVIASFRDPDVVRKLTESGADIAAQPSGPFGEANRIESAAFAKIFKKLNIKAD